MDIKTYLKTTFSKESIPDWDCPICKKGLLKLIDDKFNFEETELSKSAHKEDFWEPEFSRLVFNGILKCSACGELVMFIGDGEVEHIAYHDYNTDDFFEEYNNVFRPVYFFPPLQIFNFVDKCPNEIKKEINESFGLFWSDLPSCANKIRTSLELIMNQQKVKKLDISRGQKRPLTLHKRIEAFKLIKPNVANHLLAIKWIGNAGSHIGKLERIDLLDAYVLLEHSLIKLYDDKETELNKISKEINKRKGTRKKKN